MLHQKRIVVGALIGAAVAGGLFFAWSIAPLFGQQPGLTSTRVLDRNGGLLYEIADPLFGVRRETALADIAPSLVPAVVASEDHRFYKHHGIDWLAVARVAKEMVVSGQAQGGASTIEQQLIKTLFYSGARRTVWQKAREMVSAAYWSATHDKDETLALYLNSIYFGNRAYGVAAASQTYFHKVPSELTLAESAMLVGFIPSPSTYDPYRHRAAADARQESVLRRMGESDKDLGGISFFKPQSSIVAPHFVFHVLDELAQTLPDIESGGYVIRTSLDPALQQTAQAAVERRLLALVDKQVGNAAVLAVDPRSSEVLAYVGSADYFAPGIDGAVDMVQAKRQPGSALKPFLYFIAFMQGFAPATIIADLPVRFEAADGRPYYPRNYNYRYFGPVSLRQALASSLNIPAVKLLDRIGLISFFDAAERFGLSFPESPDHYGLGIVLGGGEVSLADTVQAYARLALGGHDVRLSDVLTISDATGATIYQSPKQEHAALFTDADRATAAAALVADVLTDNSARSLSFGEQSLLDIGKRIAVKTGTTKDFRDNWAFGYTPDFVLGVWVGNADNSPMQAISGITGAVPIWHDLMRYRFDRGGEIVWPKSSALTTRTICTVSGLLATNDCPKKRSELFIAGQEPTETDDWYQYINIDAATGLLDNGHCRGPIVPTLFLVPPPQYQAWLLASGNKQPPTTDCSGLALSAPQPLTILSPLDGDAFEINPLIDRDSQRIPFIAGGFAPSYHWMLNGQAIETTKSVYLWEAKPGEYTLTLDDRQIRFSVR